MIDTGEYKGQTEGEWEIWGDHIIGPLQRGSHKIIANFPEQGKPDGWWGDLLPEMEANMKLMADSPLLLEEVKRLREQLGRYTQFVLWVEEEHNEVFDEYEGKDEL
jgi:hypothetical protein